MEQRNYCTYPGISVLPALFRNSLYNSHDAPLKRYRISNATQVHNMCFIRFQNIFVYSFQ